MATSHVGSVVTGCKASFGRSAQSAASVVAGCSKACRGSFCAVKRSSASSAARI
ncbi:MAG: hypothetical protein JW849_07470 [Phycisphaerae bacterium]|nr:hypothetical protein [Phycisphaerae bacterium]